MIAILDGFKIWGFLRTSEGSVLSHTLCMSIRCKETYGIQYEITVVDVFFSFISKGEDLNRSAGHFTCP